MKLRHGIARLIDGYAEGYLEKGEAEPRIRRFKERLQALEAQAEQLRHQAQQQADLQLVVGRLEEFNAKVKAGLEQLDWAGRRELIRTLVKRVEIDRERIHVVFRVRGYAHVRQPHVYARLWEASFRRCSVISFSIMSWTNGLLRRCSRASRVGVR